MDGFVRSLNNFVTFESIPYGSIANQAKISLIKCYPYTNLT